MALVRVKILVGRAGNGRYYKPGQIIELDEEKARFAQSQRWALILEPVAKKTTPAVAKVDKPIAPVKKRRKTSK